MVDAQQHRSIMAGQAASLTRFCGLMPEGSDTSEIDITLPLFDFVWSFVF